MNTGASSSLQLYEYIIGATAHREVGLSLLVVVVGTCWWIHIHSLHMDASSIKHHIVTICSLITTICYTWCTWV